MGLGEGNGGTTVEESSEPDNEMSTIKTPESWNVSEQSQPPQATLEQLPNDNDGAGDE